MPVTAEVSTCVSDDNITTVEAVVAADGTKVQIRVDEDSEHVAVDIGAKPQRAQTAMKFRSRTAATALSGS